MDYLLLYLCGIADSLCTFCFLVGGISFILGMIVFCMNMCTGSCKGCGYDCCVAKGVTEYAKIKGKSILKFAVILLLLGSIIPSTKSCYAIFGVGSVLKYARNSEEVQKLPDNAVKALNYYLESMYTQEESKKDRRND